MSKPNFSVVSVSTTFVDGAERAYVLVSAPADTVASDLVDALERDLVIRLAVPEPKRFNK